MRRLMAITAFALFLAVPLWAQRGGGHFGGGGGHVGFGGGHFSGGIRSGPAFSHGFTRIPSSRSGFAHGPFLHDGFRHGFHNLRFHGRGFRNGCWGYGCWGYGYPWWDYYDPWWWDSGSSYEDDHEQDLANANEMNQQSLEEQRMLRQEEAEGDQDVYARPAPAPSAAASAEPRGAAITPATVLVFRDQRQREVQNYAIVGQTLWNFTSQRTEKIPLGDLDLAATIKANDERGLTFRLPGSREAQ